VLPLDVAVSTSALYELIEWQAAMIFGGNLGAEYLGTQGDVWDAQRDMSLAALGALLAMGLTFVVNRAVRRDFSRELAESLRVKQPEP
jgi:putative membrane protein